MGLFRGDLYYLIGAIIVIALLLVLGVRKGCSLLMTMLLIVIVVGLISLGMWQFLSR